MSGYEILEHTADIGLRAHGTRVEDLFEQATRGLCDIAGIWQPDRSGACELIDITVEARDREGLLVDWLSEVLYVHDARNAALSSVQLSEVGDERAVGRILIEPLGVEAETAIQIKAVTYHQLAVRKSSSGWSATVFFDI
ncbi:MAG: archease [Actinomycetota bacterium]